MVEIQNTKGTALMSIRTFLRDKGAKFIRLILDCTLASPNSCRVVTPRDYAGLEDGWMDKTFNKLRK